MTKEFIPYQQALDLKELGFDEPCLAYWYNETPTNSQGQCLVYYKKPWDNQKIIRGIIRDYYYAPLYQQAFRFFREKYDLVHEISWSKYKGGLNFDYDIFSLVLPTDDELGDEDDVASDKSMETYDSLVDKGFRHHESNTYEEAELTCLIKLIEIVKDGKSKSNS
jgi:hypothetical protein